jgi:predicted Zn-dependent protease
VFKVAVIEVGERVYRFIFANDRRTDAFIQAAATAWWRRSGR